MSRRQHFVQLADKVPVIMPSLLASDFVNLEREIRRLEQGGAQALHLDVMDGRFVPNITIGIPVVAAIRRTTDLPLDVHLMIVEPEKYVPAFFDAGADNITVHIEAVRDAPAELSRIRELGAAAGITLRPHTPVDAVADCLAFCDLVLVMSVEPGFGGQEFDTGALGKLRALRSMAPPDTLLEVDGGVNEETIGMCAEAGAQVFVAGSAVFRHSEYGPILRELSRLAAAACSTR